MKDGTPTKVVIAGAAGFVGLPLVERLARTHRVIALSRSQRESSEDVEWRECDLLSQRQAMEAVRGAELAVYLVHSMLPSDRLVQGSFEDFDLQAADNFARACAAHGVRQIVYLGGLLPADVAQQDLSRHLRSRAEVERALADHGTPVTVLRAGLILGPGGSSVQIVLRLVRRLPLMVCPSWTKTPSQPIALSDVLELLCWVLDRDDTFSETFDIGGPDVVTYRKLMSLAAGEMGRSPVTLGVPLLTPTLSRLWISLVTGAPRALAAPLVESLSHSMVARDRRLQERAGVPGLPIDEALRASLEEGPTGPPRAFRASAREDLPLVRSVQRMSGTAASPALAAAEYPQWLERAMPFLESEGDTTSRWSIRSAGVNLLAFELDESGTSATRVAFAITGGKLAARPARGRFELRSVLGGDALLCSVHGFHPRLWWPVYVATQAQAHLLVMRAFARYLRRRFPVGQRPAGADAADA